MVTTTCTKIYPPVSRTQLNSYSNRQMLTSINWPFPHYTQIYPNLSPSSSKVFQTLHEKNGDEANYTPRRRHIKSALHFLTNDPDTYLHQEQLKQVLAELMEIVLTNYMFKFNENFYLQKSNVYSNRNKNSFHVCKPLYGLVELGKRHIHTEMIHRRHIHHLVRNQK